MPAGAESDPELSAAMRQWRQRVSAAVPEIFDAPSSAS